MNSKKNVIQFYIHLFKDLKDLSRMLCHMNIFHVSECSESTKIKREGEALWLAEQVSKLFLKLLNRFVLITTAFFILAPFKKILAMSM